MVKFVNRAKVATSTTGTGTITLGAAEAGFQTFGGAGLVDGDVVSYVIEEGDAFEVGTGTFNSTGPTLTRNVVESSNADAAINLNGAATVFVTAASADLVPESGGTFSGNVDFGTGIDVTGDITVTGTVDGRDVAADGTKLDGIESGATADQTITAGTGLTGGGTGDVTVSHADTSTQASVDNAGNTVIQDVTLDGFGHVTGLASTTLTTTNDATITLAAGTSITGGGTFTTNQSTPETITFNHGDTSTISGTFGSTASGTKIDTITIDANGHVTAVATGDTGDIDAVTAGTGLTGGGTSGSVTLSHSDTSAQGSVNNSGNTVIQDVTLDGFGHVTALGSVALSIPNAANNASISISAGSQLTGGGTFTTDQSFNETITLNHGDTSGLSGTYGSTANGTKIDTITVDSNGHVTAVATGATGDIDAVNAGSGLTGGGTSGSVTLNHQDTSSQGSVNNSGNTFIQDITLDGFGHVTSIGSAGINEDAFQGTAKAWVNFNGSGSVSIRDSFNVSSISDFGTGNYGVNFSSNFAAGNYAVGAIGENINESTGSVNSTSLDVTSPPASSSCRLRTGYSRSNFSFGAYLDGVHTAAIFTGD
jgi:hypothetical protein